MDRRSPTAQHYWNRTAQSAVPFSGQDGEYNVTSQSSVVTETSRPTSSAQKKEFESAFWSKPPRGRPMKLFCSVSEKKEMRDTYDDMSDLFSIITATERLETIRARYQTMPTEAYEKHCQELITNYKMVRASTENTIPRLDNFIAQYEIRAAKARHRLVYGFESARHDDQTKFVLRCTTLFHHLGNCLDCNQLAVSSLLPDLTTLMKMLSKVTALSTDYEFHTKSKEWVERLNAMPPSASISEDQAIEMKLDLDRGFADYEMSID